MKNAKLSMTNNKGHSFVEGLILMTVVIIVAMLALAGMGKLFGGMNMAATFTAGLVGLATALVSNGIISRIKWSIYNSNDEKSLKKYCVGLEKTITQEQMVQLSTAITDILDNIKDRQVTSQENIQFLRAIAAKFDKEEKPTADELFRLCELTIQKKGCVWGEISEYNVTGPVAKNALKDIKSLVGFEPVDRAFGREPAIVRVVTPVAVVAATATASYATYQFIDKHPPKSKEPTPAVKKVSALDMGPKSSWGQFAESTKTGRELG